MTPTSAITEPSQRTQPRPSVLSFASVWRLSWILAVVASATFSNAQVSPEEHAKHHPNQAAGKATAGGAGMAGGQGGGMMGGGMGGMMDSMMERMGAPKPKELYPPVDGPARLAVGREG